MVERVKLLAFHLLTVHVLVKLLAVYCEFFQLIYCRLARQVLIYFCWDVLLQTEKAGISTKS